MGQRLEDQEFKIIHGLMGGETVLALEDDVASKQEKKGVSYFSYWDFILHSMYAVGGKLVLGLQNAYRKLLSCLTLSLKHLLDRLPHLTFPWQFAG